MRVLSIRLFSGMFAIAGMLVSSHALSDSVAVEEEGPANVSVQEPRSQSGLMMHIDPDTGETLGYRRPDPKMIRADERLRQALSRSHEGLEVVELEDGTLIVDLQGRFHHAKAARLDDKGLVEQGCMDEVSRLSSFLVKGGWNDLVHEGEER